MPLLAVMVHERPPLQVSDLPGMAAVWLQDAGGFAAMGLALWLVAYFVNPGAVLTDERWPRWKRLLFTALVGVAVGGYFLYFSLKGIDVLSSLLGTGLTTTRLQPPLATLAGACALMAVLLPFLFDLPRWRWRRISALAWLSFKEATRSKVPYVFALLAVVFLFADWFLPHKPENQLRTFVQVMYWAMTPLLLLTAMILAAFGIPTDLRQQTLHTVVTKPVERFEIVAGRFLGYTGLLSVLLVVITCVSLLYVSIYGVHPDAARESWRARVPVYGDLEIYGLAGGDAGVNVGREWEYRRYIPGGAGTTARATWHFTQLPGRLDDRAVVPCEFTFAIFRMTKGEENKGVLGTFFFETWRWNPANKTRYDAELAAGRNDPDIYNRLAEKYGYYEVLSKEVFDKHLFIVDVPAGLFKNARQDDPQRRRELEAMGQGMPAPVRVAVRCDNPTQFLGMAKHDLYLVDGEGWFAWNFFKGALGLWFRLCLVVGVAVACSTYLSGVVSMLVTLLLFVGGLVRPFIISIAANTADGGGPAEALLRLAQRQAISTPLEKTPTVQTAGVMDDVFRWLLTRILNFIPDVDRFDLSQYVSEGFDIGGADLFMCLMLVVGYLLPWAVLGYYLLKSREVAS